MSDTSVKVFLSSQVDILPQISRTPGSLYSVLKACLVTGAGVINVQSLVVTGGVATATFATAHGYLPGQVVAVAGANLTALNGEARTLAVPHAQAITFATTAADGTAEGSITCRLAPAGWEEVFSGADVGVLRSLHEDASGACLRVDDTAIAAARVVGYMEMSDIDTGTDPFPADSQQAGGLYWPKANNATGTRTWALVADGRAFYLYIQPTAANANGLMVGFGDLETEGADPWAVFLSGQTSTAYTGGAGCLSIVGTAPSAALAVPRPATGFGVSELGYLISPLRASGISGHGAGSQHGTFPEPARGAVLLTPALVIAGGLRGRLPGLLHTPQGVAVWITALDRAVMPGYLPVSTYSGSVAGLAFLQTEGAWRPQ